MIRNISANHNLRYAYSTALLVIVLPLLLGTAALAQESRRVRMAYSAFSVSFLNIFIARDAGLFKKHGLELELIQMAGPLPVAALAAGEIDFLTGYTTGIVATGQGAPLKGIMIGLRKPPFFLVAEPSVSSVSNLARDRKSTRLNSSHIQKSRMPSSA